MFAEHIPYIYQTSTFETFGGFRKCTKKTNATPHFVPLGQRKGRKFQNKIQFSGNLVIFDIFGIQNSFSGNSTCMVEVWYMLKKHIPCFKCRCTKGLRSVMVYGYMFLEFLYEYLRNTANTTLNTAIQSCKIAVLALQQCHFWRLIVIVQKVNSYCIAPQYLSYCDAKVALS